ncbi:MAG: ABC transporter ATP-binding protein/permease [Roseburia sp.]|nr:ABC transporter ATP-binding protein/permease [Roseburia sp.]
MFSKVNYILDKKQKIKLALMLVIIFAGAFVELLGVSCLYPLINVAMDPEVIESTWYLRYVNEIFGFGNANQMILFLALLLIAVYIFKNVYITFMYGLQYRFIFNNQRYLAVKMMDAYMHQSYLFHVSRNVAELQRNVSEDVNGFYTVVLNTLQLLAEASVCVVLIIFLMRTDIFTTLVIACLIGVFSVIVGVVFKKVLVKKGEENRQTCIKVNKWIFQSFNGIKEIKVAGCEDFFIDNYDRSFKRFTVLQRQQSLITFIPRPVMEVVCVCGILSALIIKMYFLHENVSGFIPVLSVFAIAAFRMLPSFNRMSGFMSGIMFDKPSVDVLYNDLVEIEKLQHTREKRCQDAGGRLSLKKEIRLHEVGFRYPNVDKWVLKDVSFEIKSNTSVALIGESGAGKTTLVDIILGILEPQKGQILVDGGNIRENMSVWRRSIGYIPQTIYLMDDTIRANIAFGIEPEEIDEGAMRKALSEAMLDTFVEGLPEGLDTIIGERGVKLSGGQRQRIGIARALYRQPDILILDEATSALDNKTEKEVMEAIDGLHGQRTLIVIAHRLTTIRNCDVIYEIIGGGVRERSHQEIFG